MQGAMIVTPLYAALLALWFVLLSARVIQYRGRHKVSLGDADQPDLRRAIRGHANFVEYVPLALLLLLVLELSRMSLYLLHAIGVTLVIARLLHGYAFAYTAEWKFGRRWGMALTFIVLLVEAVLCLYQTWRGHLIWLTT
jgi:uncharacterized membrane protein YecN with MAPEG domain